ncbi:MAG: pirin family protein [Nanoarchaeota archaeon]|nr:pirin family protein [Nanoarchaeota archaeon]
MPRKIILVKPGIPTIEGAGVHLFRAFSYEETKLTDPFLLLDHFHSKDKEDYMAGFPWHPHRGIETVTYILSGKVEHGDSLGNKGMISEGDVQWMTAGSGIIHQEMPQKSKEMNGLQLWVNLSKKEKMCEPKYRSITHEDIPEKKAKFGSFKIIAGEFCGSTGPAKDLILDITYLDISLDGKKELVLRPKKGYTVFIYVLDGVLEIQKKIICSSNLAVFDKGEGDIIIQSERNARFIYASGPPLNEPIAWHGPIVMNTDEEISVALREMRKGTFIKHKIKKTD